MSYPLRVFTPEGPVFDNTVDAIQLTAFEGSMGILTNHAPMLAALLTGPAKITVEGKDQWYVFGEGTLEVRPPEVILLIDFAEKVGSHEEAKAVAAKDKDEAASS